MVCRGSGFFGLLVFVSFKRLTLFRCLLFRGSFLTLLCGLLCLSFRVWHLVLYSLW